MNEMLLGAIGTCALVAGLIFARFWRTTRDRLFLFFAASFWVEGINRFMLAMFGSVSEDRPVFYLIRLGAFLLIVIAIFDKNRSRGRNAR